MFPEGSAVTLYIVVTSSPFWFLPVTVTLAVPALWPVKTTLPSSFTKARLCPWELRLSTMSDRIRSPAEEYHVFTSTRSRISFCLRSSCSSSTLGASLRKTAWIMVMTSFPSLWRETSAKLNGSVSATLIRHAPPLQNSSAVGRRTQSHEAAG